MTPLIQFPDPVRSFVLSLYLAVFIALLFLLLIRLARRCYSRTCLTCGSLLLAVVFIILCLMEGQRQMGNGLVPFGFGCLMGNLPWMLHALTLTAIVLYSGIGLLREREIAQTEITPDSIREALDNLPSGLCFSAHDGLPLLTNRRMYDLAWDVDGRFLQNAHNFWQSLERFEGNSGVELLKSGPSPVLRQPDGSVWRFAKTELSLADKEYTKTTASDITDLHQLSVELAEGNTALERQQRQLEKLLEGMIEITREEEILAFKVHIHNELGHCALTGRRSLEHPSGEGVKQALALWGEVANRLEISAVGTTPNSGEALRQITELVALLGCTLEIEGGLPENEDTAYLLLSAIKEAVTNAVRHGKATRVTVKLQQEGDALTSHIADNGTGCSSEITEGSGLTSLRSRIEQAGGEMNILCNEGVSLHLWLPLTREEE